MNELDIDYRTELEAFSWHRPRWSSDKLIAASPFRDDQHPSFFVSLEHGGWRDSGAFDAEWESGNFTKLLAYLRSETYEETADYLRDKYGMFQPLEAGQPIVLKRPNLRLDSRLKCVRSNVLDGLADGSPYLVGRGIKPAVCAAYGVKSAPHYTAIPWRLPDGRLANVKYRSHRGKTFWYAKDAYPIKQLLWGVDAVNKGRAKRAAIVEAEIDGLSWASAGIAAVATGGTHFTDKQADILRRSAVEVLILGGDSDAAGRKFNRLVASKMAGYVSLEKADYGQRKDANEVLESGEDFSIGKFRQNIFQI